MKRTEPVNVRDSVVLPRFLREHIKKIVQLIMKHEVHLNRLSKFLKILFQKIYLFHARGCENDRDHRSNLLPSSA